MEEVKHGTITITQSVGNMQSVGEGSPEHAEVTKENLPPKKTRGRPKGSKNGSVKPEAINVMDTPQPKPWSKVRLGYGVTKSIGNFEFVRIDVSAEDYCPSDEKQKTWQELDVVVSERIQKCIAEYERFRASKYITPTNEVVIVPEAGSATDNDPMKEETNKHLTKLIMHAAKFGKIRYAASMEKKKTVITENLAQALITQLEGQDYSFFEERQNGECEGIIEGN